jgi:predicted transcriptional regulator
MAIPFVMAKMTVRSTFALDPETVATLDRLADKWDMSKSETLRRVIEAAARVEDVDASADALAALGELQERLALTPEKTEAWLRETRALRQGRRP